ncbi:MAG TPA: tetratricopeptide repeat protein [Rhizomicrobium sp.]
MGPSGTFIALLLLLTGSALAADAPPAGPVAGPLASADALRAGRAGDAENLATEALAAKDLAAPDRSHLLLNRALAREELGRRRDALSDFDDAIALKALPEDELSRAWFDRGVTLDELGRTDEAIGDYSAALKLAPQFAPALNNRANAERRLGRLPEAKADYQAALAANDKEKEYPYYGLGQIAEAEGNAKDAAEDYRMALAANGQYTLAAQRLAALGTQPGKIDLQPPTVSAPPVVTASYEAPPDLRPAILGRSEKKSVAPKHVTPKLALVEAASGGGTQIQLGAFRDETSATTGWKDLIAKSDGALDGLTPQVVVADIPGKGRFYRLRTTVSDDASGFCAKLTAKKLACLPVK